MQLATRFCFFITVIMTLGLASCQGQSTIPVDIKQVSSRDLFRAARERAILLMVYGSDHPDDYEAMKESILSINRESNRGEILLMKPDQVSTNDLAASPLLLLGNPINNPWISALVEHLPFKFKEDSLQFDFQSYAANEHVMMLSYFPNPYNQQLPISVITSFNDQLIADVVEQNTREIFRNRWDYQILKGTTPLIKGNFSQEINTRWEIDNTRQIKLPSQPAFSWEGDPYTFHSYHHSQDTSEIQQFINDRELELQKLMDQLDLQSNRLPDLQFYLYPSIELKGLMLNNTEPCQVNFIDQSVHTVVNDLFPEASGLENKLILRSTMGTPSYQILETGLSVYFTDQWKSKGFQHWAQRLLQADQALTIQELLEDRPEHSPLIKQALAGSLVEFLINEWGLYQFKQHYHQWHPTQNELSQLNQRWMSKAASPPPTEPVLKSNLDFMRGFNFTHEGYSIYNGYGSQLSVHSLERLKHLHSNAVALVPYTGMRETKTPGPFNFSQRAGSETDESVVHAILNAKKLGMTTILKPHIWVRGGWPGDIEMQSPRDWDQFFQHYFQWISHYALLAEMYQADIFCIGVEFSQATLQQEAHWRALIDKVRKIYGGPLTYAANWGDEFENLKFWDQLDYIGLNCYYPISKQNEPDLARLRKGVREAMAKVDQVHRRYDKPVLLTEIGFRSVQSPWKQPHELARAKPFNQEHQAKAYRAVLEELPSYESIAGIFWWKWPTVLESDSPDDRRFVPYDKKAEQMVERYFRQYSKKSSP